jgi:hypothetical protein
MSAPCWPQSTRLVQVGTVASGWLWSTLALAQTPPEAPTPDGGLGRVFGVMASIAFVFGFGRQVRNWYKRRARDKRLQAERPRRP